MKNLSNFIKKIELFIEAQQLIIPDTTIIVGLSGGPDSVFLLHFLARMQKEKNLTLIAAHLDHGWRPESVHDAQWCAQLAQQYGIPIIVKTLNELPITLKYNGSKEEIGRKARRYFFESLAHEKNAHAIALAHHADDQQEIFFIRLIRGASLAGLTGMQPKDGLYIRPLLQTKKQNILDYLQQEQIAYRIDASNTTDDFLRNRIRMHIIPALQKCDGRFDLNFSKTHAQLQQTDDFITDLANTTFAQLSPDTKSIDIDQFLALHEIMRYRIIVLWLCAAKVPFTPSTSFFHEIIRFLQKPSGCHTIGSWIIKKNKNSAYIEKLSS